MAIVAACLELLRRIPGYMYDMYLYVCMYIDINLCV